MNTIEAGPGRGVGEHPNAARIRALFEAFRARDVEAIRDAIAEDAVWHFPGRGGSLAGAHAGHGAIFAFLARVGELSGGTFELELQAVLADDAWAAAFFRGRARREGRELDNPTCLQIRLEAGRAVEIREFVWDLYAVDAFWSPIPEKRGSGARDGLALRAIDHVTLQARDPLALAPYYRDIFGFACTELGDGGVPVLQLERGRVRLFIAAMPELDPGLVARQHVSFEVESLEPVVARLAARGEPHHLGRYAGFAARPYRWCEWRDPEGIRVECVEIEAAERASP